MLFIFRICYVEIMNNVSSNGTSSLHESKVICSVNSVLKFDAKNEVTGSGTIGTLCLSSTRIYFVQAGKDEILDSVTDDMSIEFMVPLTAIKDIEVVIDSRVLNFEDFLNAEAVNYEKLAIRCKDFREITLTFQFQTGVLQFMQSLWAKLFKRIEIANEVHSPKSCPIDSFFDEKSWKNELDRIGVNNRKVRWKIMRTNLNFECCRMLGPFSVIPNSIEGAVVARTGFTHENCRYMTWCWTNNETMVSLIRCSEPKTILNNSYLNKIISTMNKSKTHLVVNRARLKDYCPSEETIAYSFEKLWNTLILKDEMSFFRHFESSKWLLHIQSFLRAARHTARTIILDKNPVAVMDATGADISCIVTALVQILIDPYYRTIHGLINLINKEWISSGYPFGFTLMSMNYTINEQSSVFRPTFVLFLDCIHNIISQYPLEFEYTDYFLIRILDHIFEGKCPVFMFKSIKSMTALYTINQIDDMIKLFWNEVLSEQNSYFNPLYQLKDKLLDIEKENDRFNEDAHRNRSQSYMYAVQKGFDKDQDKGKRRNTMMMKTFKKAHIHLSFHKSKKKIRKPRDKQGANFFVPDNESSRERLSSIANIFKSKNDPININYSLIVLKPWDRLFFRYQKYSKHSDKHDLALKKFSETVLLACSDFIQSTKKEDSLQGAEEDDVSQTESIGTTGSDRLERSVHLSDLDLFHDKNDKDYESPDELSLNNLSVENSDYSSPVVMSSSIEGEKRLSHVYEEPEMLNSKSPKTLEKEIAEAANDIHDV